MKRAFTLIELLVVIAIIGLLAVIGLPAMRGMTRSNATIAANRQFLDDLAYARQRAISDHTTVFVVFVPTNIVTPAFLPPVANQALYKQYTNLFTGQYTSYALLSMRQLGEQPGQATPKYLTDWRRLPNGVFIAQTNYSQFQSATNFFPFPVATNYPAPNFALPYIAFNYLGQLLQGYDETIALARGSIFYDPTTFAADVQENPAGNSSNTVANPQNTMYDAIYINALTGRAKVLQQQVQ